MVLLETGTPGTSREIYSEDADDGTQTHNPSVNFDKYKSIATCMSNVLYVAHYFVLIILNWDLFTWR